VEREHRVTSKTKSIIGIYDFEIFPFALGDVLTWNVRSAMRCEDLGRERVDVYICANEGCLGNVHQRGIVNVQNFNLLFQELYSAFGTNPKLGNIFIYRRREELIARLREVSADDPINEEAVEDYLGVLRYRVVDDPVRRFVRRVFRRAHRDPVVRSITNWYLPSIVQKAARKAIVSAAFLPEYDVINNYFTKYVVSHERINDFAARRGGIPTLRPALGCEPDVDELIAERLSGRKIVPFHLRLRRLDAGYGGEHSYSRDSNFLEWYDFLREASSTHPEVAFVALGRLQEKPLELLRLPNVTSLRLFGMGLGHELTLLLKSDLFIGSSSGFAALANFSRIPYFITQMTREACHVYAIPEGAERLPFALNCQTLIYERETSELLSRLLREGLNLAPAVSGQREWPTDVAVDDEVDLPRWLNNRLRTRSSAATTSRFFLDDKYRCEETSYLLLVSLQSAGQVLLSGARDDARRALEKMGRNFGSLCQQLPEYASLVDVLNEGDPEGSGIRKVLRSIEMQLSGFTGSPCQAERLVGSAWRPSNWVVNSDRAKPLPGELQPAWCIQGSGANSYLHTERFLCDSTEGRIVVCFDAKNSDEKSYHRVHVFEDGKYYSVGLFVAETEWRTFEIPVTTNPGSILEIQIDQEDKLQWLFIRDFHILHGRSLSLIEGDPVTIPMSAWTTNWDAGSALRSAKGDDGMKWNVADRKGFVQTPWLPQPGRHGLIVRFEACTDKPTPSFTQLHLFEGDGYRLVAKYAFTSEWTTYSILLEPDQRLPAKIQIDYPEDVNLFSIRNFQAIPVGREEVGAQGKQARQ